MISVDYKSTQVTNQDAVGWSALKPYERGGRLRIVSFDYTVPTGTIAIATVVSMATLPPGVMLLGGKLDNTALGTGALADIGLRGHDGNGNIDDTSGATVADDADLLGNDIDMAAAGNDDFNHTAALNFLYVTKKEVDLVFTVVGAVWAAAAVVKGYLMYSE